MPCQFKKCSQDWNHSCYECVEMLMANQASFSGQLARLQAEKDHECESLRRENERLRKEVEELRKEGS